MLAILCLCHLRPDQTLHVAMSVNTFILSRYLTKVGNTRWMTFYTHFGWDIYPSLSPGWIAIHPRSSADDST